jgi:hypothetical protein
MGPVADDVQRFFYYLASAQQIATDETSKRYEPDSRMETVVELDDLLQKAVEAAVTSRAKVHKLLALAPLEKGRRTQVHFPSKKAP